MKTGIELIAIERQEQIEKHGWDLTRDQDYKNGELSDAAVFCLTLDDKIWPWNDEGIGTYFKRKIEAKSYQERVIISGAFCAAELDRLSYSI